MARDYDKEIEQLSGNILQLDESAKETMLLEVELGKDLAKLEAELGSPAVALDKKAFAKVNATIEATHVKLATARRSMGAISKARGELDVQRQNVTNAKHMEKAQEYSRSAAEMGKVLDEEVLPELREVVDSLVKFVRAGDACVRQAAPGGSTGPRTLDVLSMTFAKALRDTGLNVMPGESIRTAYSNYEGYATVADALAEFRAAVETPDR